MAYFEGFEVLKIICFKPMFYYCIKDTYLIVVV